MAKYTLTLKEYLEAGFGLPASFSLIEGFKEVFVSEYCDKEIGFETPLLFTIKLTNRANLLMQEYADRIKLRATYLTKADNPAKVVYEKTTTNYNLGATKSKNTELPFDSETAKPNSITESDAVSNDDKKEMTRNESGLNSTELITMLDYLNKDIKTLTQTLLNEFSDLFMKVY